jgi:hypothetical protein
VTETSKVVDVLLPLGGKQHSCVQGHLLCLLYTLCLMQLSVAQGVLGRLPASGLLVIDAVGLWSMYFFRIAQSESHSDSHDICTLSLLYQLPNCNLFTQHIIIYLMERHH